MKYAWIDTQRSVFPLPVLCDALSVSQSGFRAWQAGKQRQCWFGWKRQGLQPESIQPMDRPSEKTDAMSTAKP